MSLGGVPIQVYNTISYLYNVVNIPFSVDASGLEQAFRRIVGFENIEVEKNGDSKTGAKYVIYYIGYNQDLPDLVINGANLIGGRTGTTPQIVAATRREFSTNLFVDPIDYRWMRTYSNKANVRVTVNEIPSACNTDCGYIFYDEVPSLIESTLTTSTLSLTLNNTDTLISIDLSDIKVTLDNQPCVNLTGDVDSFTCELPTNSDATPILTAGSHYPVVTISGLGIVSIDED